MKQTAVEWLEEQMLTWGDKPRWMRDDMVKQAKEMEKEQVIDAHECGYTEGILHSCESGEQYYNETFKSE